MTHDVFICHSSRDRTIANAICATLEQRKIRCWIAPRDVLPGMEYAGAIVEAITGSKLTVLLFSGNSNASPHVRREIERTVSHGIPVLPFRIEDVVPSPALEYFISDAHWLDAMTPPLEQHLDHLVGTVRLLLDRQASATAPVAPAPPPPPPPTTAPLPPPPLAVGSYTTGPRRRPAWQWAALGIGGVAAVVLAGLIVLPRPAGPVGIATASPIPIATVAPTASPGRPPATAAAPTNNLSDDFVDTFDGTVRTGWSWVGEDPARWNLSDQFGWLTIVAPEGPPLTNLLLYELDAPSFAVTTRIRFAPTSDRQFAGLVLTGEDPNADRLQFGWGFRCEAAVCLGSALYFDRIVDGDLVGNPHSTLLTGSPTEMFIALQSGLATAGGADFVYATYSYDGGDDWLDGGIFPFDDAYTKVGLIVLDAEDEIAASFEYVYIERFLE